MLVMACFHPLMVIAVHAERVRKSSRDGAAKPGWVRVLHARDASCEALVRDGVLIVLLERHDDALTLATRRRPATTPNDVHQRSSSQATRPHRCGMSAAE